MQFNVARLLKEPVGTSKHQILDATFAPLEGSRTDHVWGEVHFVRVDRGVWVSSPLEASAISACSRCLQDFSLSVRFQVDDIYVPLVDVNSGVLLPLPKEANPGFTIDDHHVLDISEAVRQFTILALPMKPLCKADCAGICAQCGDNRNEIQCNCQDDGIDSRWTPLLKLLSS